jgi:transcription antitermination factor NusG
MDIDSKNSLGSWFALHVKSRYEQRVAAIALNKGYRLFLPLYKARRRWSDRVQEVDLPLFPGYLFCRLGGESWLPLLKTPGVFGLVGVGKTAQPIDDTEITTIQATVESGLLAKPWPFMNFGQRVLLEHGPLAGTEGYYVEDRKQHRIVVSVSLLQRSVGIEIDREWVRPVQTKIVPTSLHQPMLGVRPVAVQRGF